ncbi:hypothetical protein EV384_4442 [Micromonospora kangleipakensis]|uniref:Uncharacterized protein n=2 Tax=Micromonospora kangleipakensis TaxID=1077942 RepID=A0A4Q8BDB4_9ACTN|nr:hypothetical protein EV384_4442 [Micromonospora kangleipakensis]
MRNLCRFLLQGHTRSQKAKITGLPDWHQLLDHSPDAVNPLGGYGFYPCGMEYALDRTAPRVLSETRSLRVLLLPVPDKESFLGYGGVVGPDNAGRVSAALRLLWSRGAFGGPGQQLLRSGEIAPPVPPQSGLAAPAGGTLRVADDAWVGAYSSGGEALWALLNDPGNRATASRVLVFDTVKFHRLGKERLLMPKGSLWPEKLLELTAKGNATARAVLPLTSDIGHRPAGHEAAADDSGKPLLLVYPIGPSLSEPYVSVTQPGLAERMKSLVGTMFSAGAVASTATAPGPLWPIEPAIAGRPAHPSRTDRIAHWSKEQRPHAPSPGRGFRVSHHCQRGPRTVITAEAAWSARRTRRRYRFSPGPGAPAASRAIAAS